MFTTRMMRMLLITTIAMAVAAPGGVQAQQKMTTCDINFDADISPGFWREGNSGTFTSNGETGAVTCDGPVNGKMPTGPGTFGVTGHYGTKDPDTCDNLEGDYETSMTLPVEGGKQTTRDKGTFAAGTFKGNGAFGGEFSGERAYGTFDATPREGDCFTSPMTKNHTVVHWFERG